jgi:hypothetical protein
MRFVSEIQNIAFSVLYHADKSQPQAYLSYNYPNKLLECVVCHTSELQTIFYVKLKSH